MTLVEPKFKSTPAEISVIDIKLTPYYSNEVLVGNWYEDRVAQKTDARAIVPCIYGQSGCTGELSSYQRHFGTPNKDTEKATDEFLNWNQDAFANYVRSVGSNILLFNGEQFVKNMTTMTDIMFNIRPKTMGKLEGESPLKKKPKEDFMRGYGNATQTGLRHWKGLRECCENKMPLTTTYRREFKPKCWTRG